MYPFGILLIEPRSGHAAVPFVLHQALSCVQHTTIPVVWAHGPELDQKAFLAQHPELIRAGADTHLRFWQLPLKRDNLTLLSYSRLLTSTQFWARVQAEQVLIVQTDACFHAESPFGLRYWQQLMEADGEEGFDYVGAPWPKYRTPLCWPWSTGTGNGGVSWRRTQAMLQAIETLGPFQPRKHVAEDVYFGHFGAQAGCVRTVPSDLATRFCVDETLLDDQHATPWLTHKAWRFNCYENKQLEATVQHRFHTHTKQLKRVHELNDDVHELNHRR